MRRLAPAAILVLIALAGSAASDVAWPRGHGSRSHGHAHAHGISHGFFAPPTSYVPAAPRPYVPCAENADPRDCAGIAPQPAPAPNRADG